VLVDNETIARAVAASIQSRQEGYRDVLLAYAARAPLREAVKRRDRAEALAHLGQLREALPELDQPSLVDPAGVLWATVPEEPQIYGTSFAHRDWYQGVSREWRPYTSEVFRLATRDQALAVVLAVPVRSADGRVIGILGSVQRLETIRQSLPTIRLPDGGVFVVDKKGRFVFHPTRTGPDHLNDFAEIDVVRRLLRGESGAAALKNPVEGTVRLSAYQPLPSLGWGVVVYRDKNLAFQDAYRIIAVSGAIALLFMGALAVLGTVAFRRHRQRAALLDEQAARQRALLEVSLTLTTELSLERVLARIAEAARGLLGARYAAIGVRAEDGASLSHFVTAGMDETTKMAIGHLPTGKGLLGLLIAKQCAIRIRDLMSDPRAAGFPPGHPPMRSFLGVSIAWRGQVHGNLYVTEKEGAEEFSEADEGLALMLAAHAAVAIENARAFGRVQQLSEELVRKERLAALGRLAGGVSHEIRHPLGVIKNSVYYLRMVLPPDDKVLKHLAILDGEVATADRIVSELLEFTGATPTNRMVTDPTALVRDVLGRTSLDGHVTVATRLDARCPAISVDPEQIKQVLGNLITNAIQAMPRGGTLTVETVEADGGMLMTVSDTGVGIPPDHLDEIFEPFFTTKAKGIGLGLTRVKDLIEANGGTIGVESVPGRGSRFLVRLPGVATPDKEEAR
jgi:signal transduction histidine kinase